MWSTNFLFAYKRFLLKIKSVIREERDEEFSEYYKKKMYLNQKSGSVDVHQSIILILSPKIGKYCTHM
jgi:hypothetical protein